MIACVACKAPLPPETTGGEVPCDSCGAPTTVLAFPALFAELRGGDAPSPVVGEEAGCFYHPGSHAEVPCDRCGRFLCRLCDVEISGQHRCTRCLEDLEKEGSSRLVSERIRYDGAALSLAILPLLIFYFTLITAPIVLFVVVWYWRRPLSVLPYTRWRFVVAGLFALAELMGWIVLLALMFVGLGMRGVD
ncbi:MAG: hypothetical protein U0166_12575 [Acidobacteriota bacterium]